MNDNNTQGHGKVEAETHNRMTYTIMGQREGDDTCYELVRFDVDAENGDSLTTMQTYAGRYADEQAMDEYLVESLIAIAEYRMSDFQQNEYDNIDICPYIPGFQLRAAGILGNIASIVTHLRRIAFYELDDKDAIDAIDKLADAAEYAADRLENTKTTD